MAAKSITAVLFDWDLTLAYSISPHIKQSQKLAILFQNYGVVCTEEQVAAALQSLQEDIARGIVTGKLYPQKRSDIVRKYQKLLIRLDHPDTSYEFAYEVYGGYALLPHFFYPDVKQTLDQLKKAGFVLGVLSNHSRTARSVMEKFLAGYVAPASITLSEEEGVHKPSKTIFQRATARVKVPAEECVFVGDNLAVDAIGAVNVGEFALGVWIDRNNVGESAELPKNVHRVVRLSEVIDLIC